jgi:hypothetical protein
MKKTFLNLLAILAFIPELHAQEFEKGDIDLNIGIGLKNTLYAGSTYLQGIPPLTVSVDYGLNDMYGPGVIGIGGIVGFATFTDEGTQSTQKSGIDYSALFIGAMGSYHISLVENLDSYASLALYYVGLDQDPFGPIELKSDIKAKGGVWLFIGSKYYITERFGVFAEFGYSSSILKAGACFKF